MFGVTSQYFDHYIRSPWYGSRFPMHSLKENAVLRQRSRAPALTVSSPSVRPTLLAYIQLDTTREINLILLTRLVLYRSVMNHTWSAFAFIFQKTCHIRSLSLLQYRWKIGCWVSWSLIWITVLQVQRKLYTCQTSGQSSACVLSMRPSWRILSKGSCKNTEEDAQAHPVQIWC